MADSSPPEPTPSNPRGGALRQAGQALSLGMEVLFPSLLGWWFDRWMNSAPYGLISGGMIGFALMFLHASRLIEPDQPSGRQHHLSPNSDPSEKSDS